MTSAAAAAVTVPTIGVATAATLDPVSQEAGDFLERWLALREIGDAINQRHRAARVSMPAWAKPGYSSVRSDGTLCGPVVGFPEIADWKPPESDLVTYRIRPSLKDVLQRYEFCMPRNPGPVRTEQRRAAFAAARRWIARRREQSAVEAAAGLREFERAEDENDDAILAVLKGLADLGEGDGNIDLIAAHLFIELESGEGFDVPEEDLDWKDQLHLRVLRIASRQTTGKVHSIITKGLAKAQASAGRVS
jgi:hypothetical protein